MRSREPKSRNGGRSSRPRTSRGSDSRCKTTRMLWRAVRGSCASTAAFRWPGGRHLAVVLNVAYEGWSDGKAPGIGPMGNPLPAGAFDTNALSWGSYGATRGIERLLRVLDRAKRSASVMVSGVFGERTPATVRAIVAAGHELVAHSYAQDVIPAQLAPEAVRADIERTTAALEAASGGTPARLDQPARHAFGRKRAPPAGGELCMARRRVR